jgi:myosin heavy subunit
MRLKFAAVLLFFGLSLVACQQASQLSDMHDQTKKMSETTDKLLGVTNQMHDVTSDMSKQTEAMLEHTKSVDTKSGEMKDSMGVMTQDLKDMIVEMKGLSTQMKAMTLKMTSMSSDLGIMVPTMQKMLVSMGQLVRQMHTLPELDSEMKSMVEIAQGLCKGSRQALSLEDRAQASVNLQKNADEALTKVERAAEYLQAFEYNGWGICGDYDFIEREQMMARSTEEFFLHLHDLTTASALPSPLASIKSIFYEKVNNNPILKFMFGSGPAPAASAENISNAEKDSGYNALAASLHEVNDLQLGVIAAAYNHRDKHGKRLKVHTVSMLSMIAQALKSAKLRDEGKIREADIPTSQKHILNFKEMAIRLMQARSNILRAKALDSLLKVLHVQVSRHPIQFDLNSLSVDDLAGKYGLIEVLKMARTTDEMLQEAGIKPQIDMVLATAYKTLEPQKLKNEGSKDLRNYREAFAKELNWVQTRL